MAKNTGRNSRAAQPGYRNPLENGIWTKREASSGRFTEAKAHGGSFKGIPAPKYKAPAAWWLRLAGVTLLAIGFGLTYLPERPLAAGLLAAAAGLALMCVGIALQLRGRA